MTPKTTPKEGGFGRQLIIVCIQTNVDSGNSGTVCTRREDPLQGEMTRSPRGPSRWMKHPCSRPARGQAAEITADSNQRRETKQAKLLPSLLPSLEGLT